MNCHFLLIALSLVTACSLSGKLPLRFEANRGQTAAEVEYLSRGSGYTLFLTTGGDAVLRLRSKDAEAAVRIRLLDSAMRPEVEGVDRLRGDANYLYGSNPQHWQTEVPAYARVRYSEVYPGIDLVYYGRERQLEYDFVMQPGADAKRISFVVEGARSVRLDAGELVIDTVAGAIRQKRPLAYQELAGVRREVLAKYEIRQGRVGFALGSYRKDLPLVLDPLLVYSTFLGGSGEDVITGLAVDAAGNAYVTGSTTSLNFPIKAGALQTASAGGDSDVFISKLDPTGTSLVYSTYLGGSGKDEAADIAIDSSGNAYITGSVAAGGVVPFPTTAGAYKTTCCGVFIAKLNATGNQLLYSTFIGPGTPTGIAVSVGGAAYISGETNSAEYPITAGAYGTGTSGTGFLTKLQQNGTGLVYSARIPSPTADIAVDAAGSAYTTGGITSSDFPITPGAAMARVPGFNAFALKLNPAASALVYSTVIAAANFQAAGAAIAVDGANNAYIAANEINEFRGYMNRISRFYNSFVVSLNPTGSTITYKTLVTRDPATGLAVTSDGTAYAVAVANVGAGSKLTPGSVQAWSGGGGGDVFVKKISPAGVSLYETYFGGPQQEQNPRVAVDSGGNTYLAGQTTSPGLPVRGGLQRPFGGNGDGFVAKIDSSAATCPAPAVHPETFSVPYGGGDFAVDVTSDPGCIWVALAIYLEFTPRLEPSVPIQVVTAAGPKRLIFTVPPNPSESAQILFITVNDQGVTINQAGVSGCFPLSPDNVIAPAEGTTGTIGPRGCAFEARSRAPWVQVYPPSGAPNTSIQYTVFPNFRTVERYTLVTIGDQSFYITQAGASGTEAQRFVKLLYWNFFGRLPSASELAFQSTALTNALPRRDLVMNFFNSEEFNSGGRFVAGLYVGLLNRDAEYTGWLFQRNAAATRQVDQDALVRNFLNSAEFGAKYARLSNADFARLLYRQVLLREPTAEEVTFQASHLTNSESRVGMARAFLNSPEFRSGTGPRLTSFLLYATLLFRDPSPADLALRSEQIRAGTPISALVDAFIGSGEFLSLLN